MVSSYYIPKMELGKRQQPGPKPPLLSKLPYPFSAYESNETLPRHVIASMYNLPGTLVKP